MFLALSNHAPKMETRRALVLINLQNDTFNVIAPDLQHVGTEIVAKAKIIIPAFRRLGDVIWVRTEFSMPPANADAQAVDNMARSTNLGLDNYFPTSRARAVHNQVAPGTQPHANLDTFEHEDASEDKYVRKDIAEYFARTQPGDVPLLYMAGSHGVQIKDDLQPYVDPHVDLQVTKRHHSAFDSTALLMTLRMKFVTHIYLAGSLSNVSIYATAADAVRHGFEVTVVEDCLAYLSEAKHIEAMGKMADFLGVSGVDSEEIVNEATGGLPPPDTDVVMFSGPGLEGIAPAKVGEGSRPAAPPPPPPPLFNETREKDGEVAGDDRSTAPRSGTVGSPLDKSRASNEPTDGSTPSGGDRSPVVLMKELPARTPKHEPHRVCGPGDKIGEGDSDLLLNALSPGLAGIAFELVHDEAAWQVMHHLTGEVPRRVAVQGDVSENGAVPIYRHPADEAPPLLEFTPVVRQIRDELQKRLKQPFNHVLIQLYRNGSDHISEHSDKTLDVVRGSSIINLSLGAQRSMTLRAKKGKAKREETTAAREAQKIPMPHNSVFVLGWRTNQKWLHGVRADKRPEGQKSEAELAYGGERISLTFRHIGTFVSRDRRRVWGQGARSKWETTAGEVSSSNSAEMEAMVHAFGRENQQTDFDWDAEYGRGFDVLNLVAASSTVHLCSDELANMRVKMCALHCALHCTMTRAKPEPNERTVRRGSSDARAAAAAAAASVSGSNSTSTTTGRHALFAPSGDEAPLLREVDGASEVEGDLAILFYLNQNYPPSSGGGPLPSPAPSMSAYAAGRPSSFPAHGAAASKRAAPNLFARITQANELLFLWQELRGRPLSASTRTTHQVRQPSAGPGPRTAPDAFEGELAVWEEYAAESEYIAGAGFGIVDCAFWPVLDEITRRWQGWSERRYPKLADYWRAVGALESTRKALAERGEAAGSAAAAAGGAGAS